MNAFSWPPGGSGSARSLAANGGNVDVSDSDPPLRGQVLTGLSESAASWAGPGLAYDPSIKFWTGSTNEATIEPNTWGFVSQLEAGPPTITVSIVSSLLAPPASSKFGLYVGATVTRPVVVQVVGASQIQAPDGSLGTSCTLIAKAYYEWILYHEDGVAVWGLVSTSPNAVAGVARHPIISPPLTPNAFDDEFNGGSPVLADRGWTIVNHADNTPLTRAGNVTPFSVPANGTYRSSIIGSRIYIQVPTPNANSVTLLRRAITLAGGDVYYARLANSSRGDLSAGNHSNMGLWFSAASGGNSDLNNGIFAQTYIGNSGRVADIGRVTGGAYATNPGSYFASAAPDLFGIKFHSGSSYFNFLGDADTGGHIGGNYGGAIAGTSVVFLNIYLGASQTYAPTMPNMFQIDFIRKVSVGAAGWIVHD